MLNKRQLNTMLPIILYYYITSFQQQVSYLICNTLEVDWVLTLYTGQLGSGVSRPCASRIRIRNLTILLYERLPISGD